MPTGVPIQDILFTVFQSIFQVFLVCFAGFVLSYKGIVDKPTSKVLNHINIALFTPALLFSKVAYFLTPVKLRQLWVIPVFFTVLTSISALVARWLARACRLKQPQVNFATVASMFMNSNSIPVALMQSLVITVPALKWGPDDTDDAMFGRSLTYLVVFSTLGMTLRWSYGIRLISRIDEPEPPASPLTIYHDIADTNEHPVLTRITVEPVATSRLVDYGAESDIEQQERMQRRAQPLRSHLYPHFKRHTHRHTHQHSHLPAVPTSLGDQSESEDSDELETTEGSSEETIVLQSESADADVSVKPQGSTPLHLPSLSSSELNVQSIPRLSQQTPHSPLFVPRWILTALASLSPPLIGSLLALFCVLIPPLQRVLQSEQMIPFKGALDNAGACSIPLTLIVLGGWFWNEETNAKRKGKGIEIHQCPGSDNGAVPTSDKRREHPRAPATINTQLPARHHTPPPSRTSSTASLSAHINPRGGFLRAKRRVREITGADEDIMEPGLLATHAEVGNGNGNGNGSSPATSSLTPTSPNSHCIQGINPPGETLTIFVTLLARMFIVPLIFTPAMVLIRRLGWGGEVFEDPVFIVSCMLLIASPPALTLAQISQRAKTTPDAGKSTEVTSSFERLLSRTVFWSYCVLTPPLTIASIMVGLFLVGA